MAELEVKTNRNEYSILHEFNSLKSLVNKRHAWLNKPENKLKGTYKAVAKDTAEMETEVAKLLAELGEAQSLTNK